MGRARTRGCGRPAPLPFMSTPASGQFTCHLLRQMSWACLEKTRPHAHHHSSVFAFKRFTAGSVSVCVVWPTFPKTPPSGAPLSLAPAGVGLQYHREMHEWLPARGCRTVLAQRSALLHSPGHELRTLGLRSPPHPELETRDVGSTDRSCVAHGGWAVGARALWSLQQPRGLGGFLGSWPRTPSPGPS